MQIHAFFKPLSTNRLWRGRRFKTPEYLSYERELTFLLKRAPSTFLGPLQVELTFYMTNANSRDVDNPIKPILDILCKLGYFEDDRQIQKITATKVKAAIDSVTIAIEEYVPQTYPS